MRVSGNSTMTDAQSRVFGAELKRLRKEAELTATEFAKYVGVSPTYICNLESARRKASPQLAKRIADAFSLTVDDMLVSNDDRITEIRKKYGAVLKKHREEKGLPCAVIAGALGIPPAVYREYEQGLCSIAEHQMETLNKLLGIGEKPNIVETKVVVEVPAEVPTGICDTILNHVKDLQVDEDKQKEVWRYFSRLKLETEERRLFGQDGAI